MALDNGRDVARHERRAPLLGGERRLLRVQRADLRAFVIVEHRPVHGPGDVIERKFGRAAHVDAVDVRTERFDPDLGASGAHVVHFDGSSGCSVGQTLASNRGCASAVGWMRSRWKNARSSPKPSKK